MLNTAMLAFGNLCGAISALCLLWLVLRTGEGKGEKRDTEWHPESRRETYAPPVHEAYCTVEDVQEIVRTAMAPRLGTRTKRPKKTPPAETPDWLEIS